MSPQHTSKLAPIGVLLVALVFTIFLVRGTFTLGSAQSGTAQLPDESRHLYDLVPKDLPIKIKIKAEKEKAFKDLNNAHWTRDFELEVKNIGDKPIYFVSLVFTLPEVTMPDGNLFGFSMHYGRGEFITDFNTIPTDKDTPINPGETHVFRIPIETATGWERYQEDQKLKPPKKVEVMFDHLSYGDGTGFQGPNGRAVDRRKRLGSKEATEGASPPTVPCEIQGKTSLGPNEPPVCGRT